MAICLWIEKVEDVALEWRKIMCFLLSKQMHGSGQDASELRCRYLADIDMSQISVTRYSNGLGGNVSQYRI
jgi:hypothetical protein